MMSRRKPVTRDSSVKPPTVRMRSIIVGSIAIRRMRFARRRDSLAIADGFWNSAGRMTKIVPVLLAGGAGTRLWPVSRDALPKQFLPLVGERSTYQETLLRVARCRAVRAADRGHRRRFPLFRAAAGRGPGHRRHRGDRADAPRFRPGGRGRRRARQAAAIRTPWCWRWPPTTSSSIVEAFRATCLAGLEGRAGRPHRHLRHHADRAQDQLRLYPPRQGDRRRRTSMRSRPSSRSRMPPPPRRYVAEGYLWNSGNFLFRADVLLAELAALSSRRWRRRPRPRSPAPADDLGFLRLDPEAFGSAPQKSIDYAVMEKTDRAAVVDGNFRWSDIGSWDAIFDIAPRDAAGNAIHGTVVTMDTQQLRHPYRRPADRGARRRRPGRGVDRRRGAGAAARRARRRCASWSPSSRPRSGRRRPITAAATGPGAITTRSTAASASRSSASWCIRAARCRCRSTTTAPSTGWWCAAPPRSRSATDVKAVHENESIYIPIGAVHRLANRGKIPLELIEVQTGSYLGEDDIVRLEDVYKRRLSAVSACRTSAVPPGRRSRARRRCGPAGSTGFRPTARRGDGRTARSWRRRGFR